MKTTIINKERKRGSEDSGHGKGIELGYTEEKNLNSTKSGGIMKTEISRNRGNIGLDILVKMAARAVEIKLPTAGYATRWIKLAFTKLLAFCWLRLPEGRPLDFCAFSLVHHLAQNWVHSALQALGR